MPQEVPHPGKWTRATTRSDVTRSVVCLRDLPADRLPWIVASGTAVERIGEGVAHVAVPRTLQGVETNRSAPWARVVPVLGVTDVREAAAWYVAVFGLVEHVRVGEAHRVQLGVDGERAEVIVRELRDDERVAGTAHQVMFRVEDVDEVLTAARAAGADADEAGRDMPYGERQAGLVDPFGHEWVLTQTVRDVNPSEWGGTTVAERR